MIIIIQIFNEIPPPPSVNGKLLFAYGREVLLDFSTTAEDERVL